MAELNEETLIDYTINNGYKLLTSESIKNNIINEIRLTDDLDLQKKIIKKHVSNIENLSEDKIIELSEAMLYFVEKSTLQKSMMLGRLSDDSKVIRTKNGLMVMNSEKKYVTIPYSKITNEVIGKELAKRIRKVI